MADVNRVAENETHSWNAIAAVELTAVIAK
jgi:hypothetical protein